MDELEQQAPDYAAIELRSYASATTLRDLRRDVRTLLRRCEVLEGREIMKSVMTGKKD